MKFAVAFLVLLPIVFSASVEKRFFIDNFKHLFDLNTLKQHVQDIANKVGSDSSEAACEKECHVIVKADILGSGCPLICKSFRALVQRFNIVPKPS
ncbi:hypothetical protein LOTGIDRAFT_201103 [Lottia gigantea]|uniref:Uncharacterized protein n=1 Tax=Lottia gigantea TaxID=225164 RepID=V4A787_LOTGI|nr:hypothetical protein LOTGIDRAFT_201103 [Lottia gigantea]ESO99808.1 hypothetical protein LOTGIDRAFT_201103 [Lottia gigantea]